MNILKGLLILFAIIVLALIAIKIAGVILSWLIPTLATFIVLAVIVVAIMFLYRKLQT
jgi:hypothetical protein